MGDFSLLDPFAVIEAVESATGRRFSNFSNPLPSYINRVYELEEEDGDRYVAKFYRPGRWSTAAVLEEHRFMLDCHEAEIPVVPPLVLKGDTTLALWEGISFAVYPKRSGRDFDSDDHDAYLRLGRLLGRLHQVSERTTARERITLMPEGITLSFVQELTGGGFVTGGLKDEFEEVCRNIISHSAPLFEGIPFLRCHGDCHRGNILDRPGEGLLLIDFDDMLNGPAVQDMWMLLPGRLADSRPEMEFLLEGYTEFHPFDRRQLSLIEPLRSMRMIYYLAWCARQSGDYRFEQNNPGWGSEQFWKNEINDLRTQFEEMLETA
ncbi:MAG: serine/threonine protein kinase [Spirochaetales bacterium]|nr:serine/threonine protein kinase [Spirochaetales bacterium]